jgi:hypothetical protein
MMTVVQMRMVAIWDRGRSAKVRMGNGMLRRRGRERSRGVVGGKNPSMQEDGKCGSVYSDEESI